MAVDHGHDLHGQNYEESVKGLKDAAELIHKTPVCKKLVMKLYAGNEMLVVGSEESIKVIC